MAALPPQAPGSTTAPDGPASWASRSPPHGVSAKNSQAGSSAVCSLFLLSPSPGGAERAESSAAQGREPLLGRQGRIWPRWGYPCPERRLQAARRTQVSQRALGCVVLANCPPNEANAREAGLLFITSWEWMWCACSRGTIFFQMQPEQAEKFAYQG